MMVKEFATAPHASTVSTVKMEFKYQDAVHAARVAWLSSLTVADKQWPVRQLYGLYHLLLENRDEILDILNQGKQYHLTFKHLFS